MKMDKKGMLSQDEIDALLRQSGSDDMNGAEDQKPLSPLEQDALGEIGNISFGSAATALSTLLGQKVDITTPTVSVIEKDSLRQEFPRPYVAVRVEYTEGFRGTNMLVIGTEDAQIIADLMLGGDGSRRDAELNELHLSAVQEAMNQMMGSASTSMSTIFNRLINISPPDIDIMDLTKGDDIGLSPEEEMVKVSFQLRIGESGSLIDSNIMQLIPVSFAKEMVHILMGTASAEQEAAPTSQGTEAAPLKESPALSAQQTAGSSAQPTASATSPAFSADRPGAASELKSSPVPGAPAPSPEITHHSQSAVRMQTAQNGQQLQSDAAPGPHQPQTYGYPGYMTSASQQANVQLAQFSPFEKHHAAPTSGEQNLALLLDIPLQVTVELGRTKKQIRDILDLSPGAIVELDKLAGEPVDILVNNKLIAKGEVVVIDENFGVRVTDIISQWDRIQKLQ